jgi:hypothetical protein
MATIIKVPALRVVSKHDGFRRTDRAWSKEATTVKLSELSEEDIKAIKEEPMLVVTEVEIDEEIAEPVKADGNQAGTTPEDDSVRIAEIMAAISTLDKGDKSLWKNDGAPNTTAITALTGWSVSAAERDAAWSQINTAV